VRASTVDLYPEPTKDARHSVERSISKGKILKVRTAKFDVCHTALRSPFYPFVQKILREIDGHHMTAWPDTLRCRQCGTAHTAADIEHIHTGNDGEIKVAIA
jgi:hypothetical protein